MTTATRKYYAMIPSAFSHNGAPYWLELHDVKTITSARVYVDRFLGGMPKAEIWVSTNGRKKVLISHKSNGKWQVVSDKSNNNPYTNDQIQYFRHGPVSREEFYAGFQHHEKPFSEEHNKNNKF